jgi:hypothetical protein
VSRPWGVTAIAALAAAALGLAASLATGAGDPPPAAETPAPPSPGLVEQTGVELFLLDVEARDRSGRPLRGLTAADFVVRRNGRLWPVVSVDDFCACDPETIPTAPAITAEGGTTPASPGGAAPAAGTAPPSGAEAPGGGAPVADASAAEPPAAGGQKPAVERPLVVIYFDFGQMRSDGRDIAVKAARKWLQTVKAPDERVMIAGYVTRRGLLTLAEPTSDATRLLAALDDAAKNRLYTDDYALQLPDRIDECRLRDPTTCPIHAVTEYDHSRRSLEAFRLFLTLLAGRPGAKTVLYFHENGMMQTGAVYARDDGRTNYERTEAAGADATAAHATIYSLAVSIHPLFGDLGEQNLTLGSMLAESTGGAYNRGSRDVEGLVIAATRDCRCRYTLGFKPVETDSRRVASVSVMARGVTQRALYRVRSLSTEDRFLRQASAVLEDPGSARDLPIAATIRPTRASGRRWDLVVQVAVDARALTLMPRGAAGQGGYEAGARLQRPADHALWEMLATSQAVTGAAGAPDAVLLHERSFTGLAPGRYRVSAFMRDQVARLFGGGEATLDLPDPGKGGVAGPIMLVGGASRRVSPLPLLGRGPQPKDVSATSDTGPVPCLSTLVARGTNLRFESWICGAPGGAPAEAVASVTRDDTVILRLDDRTVTPAGSGCIERVDDMATGGLDPGNYLYVLQVRTTGAPIVGYPLPFVIGPPSRATAPPR